ncbi:MAG: tRNA (adenosine(37)-N6)-threonylcarbamoyltransferase complex transferase subunit TsaD [Candidatus Gracilibacteria bacterium]|jgi:N6-L-threonylcarbamoyladenine synthase
MLILGIETSCDETAVAIVKDGREILSNVIYSQIALHKKTGGVVPEVAAREHVVKIVPAIESAVKNAGINFEDIDAVAFVSGPGLMSSLLIGANAAQTVAHVLKKPLIAVNHVEGHIYANWLKNKNPEEAHTLGSKDSDPEFPILVLTVSGGHNELILWKNHGDYKFLGATLDDAAGEAFDKVARLLGLSYPGGPAIQKAAQNGNPENYPLPRAWVTKYDFSFSGLKTAVLRMTKKHEKKLKSPQFVADVAASFQESVCEVLATKLVNAAKTFHVREAHLAGGVSANARLREIAQKLLPPQIRLRFCGKISLCTDNAAMIAAAAYFKFKKHPRAYKKFTPIVVNPNLELKKW